MEYNISAIVALSIAVGLFMFCLATLPANAGFLAKRIDEGNEYMAGAIDKDDKRYELLKALLPYAQKLSAKNAGKVKKDTLDKIDRKLSLAGSPLAIKPIEFYNMPFVGGIAGLIIGIAFGYATDIGPMLALIGGAVGFIMPMAIINSLIKKRAEACDLALPETLDLLSVCMESGMTLTSSLEMVCSKNEGVLIDELRYVLADRDRGASLVSAFQGLTRRVQSARLAKILQAVKLSEELGTPIANQLKILSEFIRNDTFELVKQRAAKAAQTVILPVVLFILPAVALIVAGPLILNFMANGGSM